jgi:hypothetical protein
MLGAGMTVSILGRRAGLIRHRPQRDGRRPV